MTEEAQQIAIAEACGFCFCRSEVSGGAEQWHDCDGEIVHTIPNYPNDLNACHEMEKTLTNDQLSHYCLTVLPRVCDMTQPMNGNITAAVTATAPQRCEAFLKTKGLWKD